MATTIGQAFDLFRSGLEITGLQAEAVSSRQQRVRAAIESELVVQDSFLTGSYARSTMISPLAEADIDVFVVLSSQYYQPGGQAALLDRVKNVLKRTYPTTPEISRNGQAVTISFTDFQVDVVPAFFREGGGYIIPNSRGGTWIATDPKKHVSISAAANAASSQKMTPFVKMVKSWNRAMRRPFRSFHLEVLAWRVFEDIPITSFPDAATRFFDEGRTLIAQSTPDPAGYSGDVGYYIATSQDISEAKTRFGRAYETAMRAWASNAYGRTSEAFAYWRSLFGDPFPPYG